MADYQALAPFTFQPLPLGSIQPLGWMTQQLTLMADGLAGHQYEFYHIVHHSPWIGGDSEYSILNEGLPYWFNGLVPLAYGKHLHGTVPISSRQEVDLRDTHQECHILRVCLGSRGW